MIVRTSRRDDESLVSPLHFEGFRKILNVLECINLLDYTYKHTCSKVLG